MKSLRTLLGVLVLAQTLTGCLTLPERPTINLKPGSTIALAIEHPKGLKHTHIGTTMFNNDLKDYLPNYDFQSQLQKKIGGALEKKGGYKIRALTGSDFASLHDQVSRNTANQWVESDNAAATWKRLENGQAFDALVVITPAKRDLVVMSSCSQFGCSEWGTQYSGLFSRSFLGLDSYFAVAAVDISVYVKGVAVNLAPYMRKDENFKYFQIMRDYQDPKDFKALTDAEWKPVIAELEKIADQFALSIAGELAPQ